MNRELSLLLLTKAWLIDERVGTILYHNYMTGKMDLVKSKADSKKKIKSRYQGIASTHIGNYVSVRKVKTKSGSNVAIMPVVGTLTKRGDMCSYGMRDYINEIVALNENEDIVAIVLDMEGPGGTVDGTNEFGLAVRNSKKPVVVFGDYMVASADYWVASQADWIIGNKNNPTEFGSIGVLCVHEFWGKYIEENIGEIKIIRAPQSVDKAKVNPIEELTPELEKEIQEDLRGLAKEFFSAVKKGRGDKLKTDEKVWGTGKMFKIQESIEHGLIDGAGTLLDAINKAAELATSSGSGSGASASLTKASKSSNNQMKRKPFFSSFFKPKKAAKQAAADSAEETDTTPVWTEDMIFNTDGSGDGAFCTHPDTEGNDRKFETKLDNNQGNEPPTDPAITEDDNWAVVASEEAAPAEEEQKEESAADGAETSAQLAGRVQKLNAALKKERAAGIKLTDRVAELEAEKEKNGNKKAASATTVVADNDREKDQEKPKHRTSVDDEVEKYLTK
jgi:protease-4